METATTIQAAETPHVDGFLFRPLQLDSDVPRLARLLNEIETHDQVEDGTTEDELRLRLTAPDGDPVRDRWVVEEPGAPDRLIGHGGTRKVPTADGGYVDAAVHPAWRRRGLGRALLAQALTRAREKQAAYVTCGTDDRQPAGGLFLVAQGFTAVARWVLMHLDAGTALATPVLARAYTVRSYAAVQDVATLTRALNRGFIGHYEHHEDSEAAVGHWLGGPHVRPEGIFLLFGPHDEVAGVCWTDIDPERAERRGEPTGYIDALGIDPDHRRRGLGRALLLSGMQWLRSQGQDAIELDAWGHNEMALPLYEGVGFHVTQGGRHYHREL